MTWSPTTSCPLCGAEHATCGGPSSATPVDDTFEEMTAVPGPLRTYEVTTPHGVVTTMKLNEADAKRLKGRPVAGVAEPDSGAQQDPAPASETDQKDTAPPPAQHKARRPRGTKGAQGGDS